MACNFLLEGSGCLSAHMYSASVQARVITPTTPTSSLSTSVTECPSRGKGASTCTWYLPRVQLASLGSAYSFSYSVQPPIRRETEGPWSHWKSCFHFWEAEALQPALSYAVTHLPSALSGAFHGLFLSHTPLMFSYKGKPSILSGIL